jgi:hypothetical protein
MTQWRLGVQHTQTYLALADSLLNGDWVFTTHRRISHYAAHDSMATGCSPHIGVSRTSRLATHWRLGVLHTQAYLTLADSLLNGDWVFTTHRRISH